MGDATYIELKCELPGPGAINNVLTRFKEDIDKQAQYPGVSGFCLLATSGQWNDDNKAVFASVLTGNTHCFVLIDYLNERYEIKTKRAIIDNNFEDLEGESFFLIGVSRSSFPSS
jgi:hypothetical protein